MVRFNCKYHIFLLIFHTWINFQFMHCASINDTKVLLRNLLDGYNKNVRPVVIQSHAVHVNITFVLISIQDLDEIRGKLSVMGIISMQWLDANMVWDPAMYGGIDYVMTSYKEVWVPELILLNPAGESDTLGKKWQRVLYQHTGFASWWPIDLLISTCSLDMYRYPFDTQECILTFSAWGYFLGQLKLNPVVNEIVMTFYKESSTWTLAKSQVRPSDAGTEVDFIMYLKRKPGFVIVNVLLPLTFLSLLNALVFLLLPESGERISYCITVLLSIAVFMTIVSDTLPKSSEPIPVISYKLVVDMITSAFITLVTILNLRVYYMNESKDVPRWLKKLYTCFSFKRAKDVTRQNATDLENMESNLKLLISGKVKETTARNGSKHEEPDMTPTFTNRKIFSVSVLDRAESANESVEDTLVKCMSEVEENGSDTCTVSWKNISNMVDRIAFILFTLMSVCSFAVFFAISY